MSSLHVMQRGVKGADLGLGVLGWGLNAGIATGVGYVVGRARVRHPDKWYGEHSHRIAAGVGKLGSFALTVMGAPRILTGALDTMGTAGLAMQGCQWGLQHEADKQNQELRVVPKGTVTAGRRSYLGAGDGRGMSLDQIADLATSY